MPAAVPLALRRSDPPAHPELDELWAWRARTARAAGVLPEELCSDSDLLAVAAARPTSPEALAAVTGFGMLTADRLFPGVRATLDSADR